MAQKQRNRVKDVLFFAFLAISLLLVMLVWAEGLRADTGGAPGYYRSSTPLEDDAPSSLPGEIPATSGASASEEAPGRQPGSQHHGPPTSTPTGRNLDAEEM